MDPIFTSYLVKRGIDVERYRGASISEQCQIMCAFVQEQQLHALSGLQTIIKLNVTHRERITLEFNSQLDNRKDFKLYRLNCSAEEDFSQRVQVSESNYEDLKREFSEPTTSSPFPYVYVWSSIANDPYADQLDSEDSGSSSGRSISNSFMCKVGASWACMACGQIFNDVNKRMLEAAHILEIQEQGDYTAEEFNELLKSCGIIVLEDIPNLISLCTVCHNDYFDKQLIGMNVDGERNYSWIVKESVLGDALPNGREGTYADINNQEIRYVYEQQRPQRNLVLHRLKRFHEGTVFEK